jgi:hypothetical protein
VRTELLGDLRKEDVLEYAGIQGGDNIKRIFESGRGKHGLDRCGSEQGQVGGLL